ncbi:unnamed protein product [Echinostoma caproni]|uniref:Protein-serine/threonine kinase n=1 Tax=Echinostoma caproni TaxID=27848 RepID=A0A183BEB3_9TREM|nr:unnamed protein product [Echinostoma caproni]
MSCVSAPYRMLTRCVTKSVEPFPLIGCVSVRGGHWETRSYRWKDDANGMSHKERQDSVSSYYTQSAVDVAAAKHDIYLDAFKQLASAPPVETLEDEEEYSRILKSLLDEHSQVLGLLARGFKECQNRIKV